MALTADDIIDRRRLRRRVLTWRILALVALAALIVALAAAGGAFTSFSSKGSDHIARVRISGFISDDDKLLELLDELGKKNRVKAVILDISSPGGSTVGGEAIYEAVRELAGKKPVVASVGTLAASAAYMIACGTDQIVSRRSSIVGSIGVLFQYGDVSTLFDKIGVKVDAIKSAPLKAEPSPFHPASEEAKQMIGRLIDDSYRWFVDLVAERRGMDRTRALALADGSIFTGAQGLANGLVDRIGGEETARKWLVDEKGVDDALKIVDWKPKRDDDGLLPGSVSLAGLQRLLSGQSGPLTLRQVREFLGDGLFLDGLQSVMQTSSGVSGSTQSR